MRAGVLSGAGVRPAPLVIGAGAVLVALALFAGGGSSYGPLVGIGGMAIIVAAAAVAAGLLGVLSWPRLDRAGWIAVALLVALVLWMGLSVWWSVAPDLSWAYANRGFVYLAFLAIGLATGGAVSRAPGRASAGLTVLLAVVIGWALAGKVVPNLFPDGGRNARLRDPIDYWNGLALIVAMLMPLALWIAVRREHLRFVRVAGVVLLYLAGVALLLTYSRGGVVVALVVLVAFVASSHQRLEGLAAVALAAPAAIVVSAWAFTEPGVSDDLQPYDIRLRDGLQFGVVLLGVGAALSVTTHLALVHEDRWRPRIRWNLSGRRLAAGFAVAVVIAVLAASGGDPAAWARDGWREFTNPTSTAGSGPERLGDINLNSRWTWWEEAWTLFTDHPVGGVGAGAFAVARRPLRSNTTHTIEPHNLPLQFLAETGVIGFLLFAGAAGAASVAVVRTLRLLREREAAAATALAVGALAYALHSLIDYDWDFLALSATFMLVLGVLLAAGRPVERGAASRLWVAAAVLVAPVLLFSVSAPWVAERKVDDAYAAIDRRQPRQALDEADVAGTLNPLAIDPLLVSAAAYEALGDERAALARYIDAVDLQPRNWRPWYELGRFELEVGFRDLALQHLKRARELDPLGPANDLLLALGQ